MAATPFPPTAHLFGIGAAALTALLVLNPIWTGLLAVFVLVGEGALLVGAAGVEDFIEPLLAIAMLVLVVGALPLLLRMAWVRGVTAALMTPAAGAHHGGMSALASTATVVHGAQSARAALERRSSERLQQSAWRVEDYTSTAGGAATALPAFASQASGGSVAAGAAAAGPSDPPRSIEPAAQSLATDASPFGTDERTEQRPAQRSDETRLFPVDAVPPAPRPRPPETPPSNPPRMPLDDTREDR
jgi:hypothetical protein